jgi:hypothetical protein
VAVSAPPVTFPVLTESQRETLARVFADALAYRRPGEEGCKGCENWPDAALCDDHAADWDACDAYTDLAAGLGILLEG